MALPLQIALAYAIKKVQAKQDRLQLSKTFVQSVLLCGLHPRTFSWMAHFHMIRLCIPSIQQWHTYRMYFKL